jgi:hypothetical protein
LAHARLEQSDFLHQQLHRRAHQFGDRRIRFGQDPCDLLQPGARTLGDGDAELPAEAAQRVDPGGTRRHPQRAGAVQALEGLLIDRLHPHRDDVGAACRLQQRFGVGRIGLVALDVGAHVRRRQQPDFDAEAAEPARPVVRAAAGFHHDQADRAVGEPALELGTREALAFDNLPVAIGDCELKDGLG